MRPTARGSISRPCSHRWTRAASPRAWAFPFQSPRGTGYAAVNADVAAAAEASAGRVVAFARSEPGEGFLAELESGLDAGARGIKLHTSLPGYDFSHPQLPDAFALAAERRAPILFHTGRAVPPFARDLAGLLERHPGAQVILAHCAIADLHAVCALRHPNIRFDTSLWNSLDVRALLAEAAPEQLVYGSDAPYYTPIGTQAKLFPQLAAAGASDARRRDVAALGAARLLAGEPCAALSEPLAADLPLPSRPRLRAHEYLVMAMPLIWQQMPDRIGLLALARQALGEPADARAAAVLELLALADRTWPLRAGGRRPQRDPDGLVAHVPPDRARRCARDGGCERVTARRVLRFATAGIAAR